MNSPFSKTSLEAYLRVHSPQDLLSIITQERQRQQAEGEVEHRRRAAGKMTFVEFVREAWHVLEPGTTYVHGWVIDCICQHLQAVTYGQFLDMGMLNRLLFNVPPGSSKSLLVSVFWPAFEWGPAGLPWLTYLSTSHSDDVASRDSRKMRDLIESEWWQERWGRGTQSDVYLVRRGETDFANNHRGWRKCAAFTGLTGNRADRVIVDDPLSTEKAESELDRLRAARIFHE